MPPAAGAGRTRDLLILGPAIAAGGAGVLGIAAAWALWRAVRDGVFSASGHWPLLLLGAGAVLQAAGAYPAGWRNRRGRLPTAGQLHLALAGALVAIIAIAIVLFLGGDSIVQPIRYDELGVRNRMLGVAMLLPLAAGVALVAGITQLPRATHAPGATGPAGAPWEQGAAGSEPTAHVVVFPVGVDLDIELVNRMLRRAIGPTFGAFMMPFLGLVLGVMWSTRWPTGLPGDRGTWLVFPVIAGTLLGSGLSIVAAWWLKRAVDGGRVELLRRGMRAAFVSAALIGGVAIGDLAMRRFVDVAPGRAPGDWLIEAVPAGMVGVMIAVCGSYLVAYRRVLAELATGTAWRSTELDLAPDRAAEDRAPDDAPPGRVR